MITLRVFGPGFGLPDPSPFCIKADILMQLSGLPYERVRGDMRGAPKGKLPLIVDEGQTIPDSSFIRFHLETKHGIDFDAGLTPERRGICWAVEKLLEDQLYWIVVQERWLNAANFARGPAHFFKAVPAPVRPLGVALIKRKVARNLQGQGIGRHSDAERLVLARRALQSISAILGERPYLGGDAPAGADAALGAFMISGVSPFFDSAMRGAIEEQPNLVAYAQRMKARFYPDPASVRSAA